MGETVRMAPTVVIVLKAVPHYRERFLELLRERLQSEGVHLRVVYGQVEGGRALRRDTVEVPWGIRIQNRVFQFLGSELYWQPCLSLTRDQDMVIVMQEAKLLVNYVLLVRQWLGGPKVAFWGHGRSFQREGRLMFSEKLKFWASRRVHWWFAYTERSAEVVRSLGYPRSRITVVNNSGDTKELVRARESYPQVDLEKLRTELDLEARTACIMAGSLTPERNIPFLLESALKIREAVPDFELLILGSGPEEQKLRNSVSTTPWVKLVGARFGSDMVPYFALCKLLLIPGLVGLHALDSFALQVPLVTLNLPKHGPEIVYLEDGVNSRILSGSATPGDYANEVVRLLRDEEQLQVLREGCRRSAQAYSAEDMSARFAEGIVRALAPS